ncbi:phosphoserine aminotransferase [Vararia minispora EC-137]|uniref:Phosphoserine aminotransferase n=1 Tax=Vararia minispora EC-137 TaxID=1314806 RepID=A0ACB8QR30_9AGAM|nr:phosphoserine aminotransferase [Vararia minispora EC-137]
MTSTRVINFGAGPSALPQSVLEKAAEGLLNFESTGIGIGEISHRSKEFSAFLARTESLIRSQLNVPPTHHIIFTQGGGTGQFSAVVYNMLARHRLLHPDLRDDQRTLDYVLTGSWSKKAHEEAIRLGGANVHVAVDARSYSKDGKAFDNIPPHAEYTFSRDPAMIYYCDNETVDGVQFSSDSNAPTFFPFELLKRRANSALLPLVADYSSSFMSRPIPYLAEHAVIFAGAQKNLGPAGLTIVIMRQDCIVDVDVAAKLGAAPVPKMIAYNTLADSKSIYNTPPVIPIYIAGLVLERMAELGGLTYFEDLNKRKAEKVYAAVRAGEEGGIFQSKVQQGSGSWMNVVFNILGEGAEERFLAGAEKEGMKGLKGHRLVGGIRASLYNAITAQDVDKLVAYIDKFIDDEGNKIPS